MKGQDAERLAGVLAQCPALAHLDLRGDSDFGAAGAESLARVLGQYASLAHLDLSWQSDLYRSELQEPEGWWRQCGRPLLNGERGRRKRRGKRRRRRRKCNSWCGGWKKWTCLVDFFIGATNYTRHRGSASLVDKQRAQAESTGASPVLAAAR